MKTLRKVSISIFLTSQLLFSRIPRSPRYPLIFSFLIIWVIVITSCSNPTQETSPVLHRLMLFKYKAEVTQTEIDEVKQAFFGLKEKVPGMLEVVWVRDLKFNREKQYTHALTLSFISEEAMKAYEEHPDHKALAKNGPAIVEAFFGMDYWTGVDSNKEVTSE